MWCGRDFRGSVGPSTGLRPRADQTFEVFLALATCVPLRKGQLVGGTRWGGAESVEAEPRGEAGRRGARGIEARGGRARKPPRRAPALRVCVRTGRWCRYRTPWEGCMETQRPSPCHGPAGNERGLGLLPTAPCHILLPRSSLTYVMSSPTPGSCCSRSTCHSCCTGRGRSICWGMRPRRHRRRQEA